MKTRVFRGPEVRGPRHRPMPLSRAALEAIQLECHADDLPIDMALMAGWSEQDAAAYFESGGLVVPAPSAAVTLDGVGERGSSIQEHGAKDDAHREESAAAKERGNAHMKAGEFDKAVEAYRQAIACATVDGAALYSNLSLALLRVEQPAAAIAAAESSIALKPDWHKAHYRLGDARFATRDCALFIHACLLSHKNSRTRGTPAQMRVQDQRTTRRPS